VAVSAIGAALGMPGGSEQDIATRIMQSSPDDLLKLKQAEMDFSARMKELDIEVEKLNVADRSSARDREAKVGAAATRQNQAVIVIISILAIIVTIGAFYLFLHDGFSKLSALGASLITLLIRESYGRLDQVCNYCFGSSHGSAIKTDLLARAPAVK
jgi:hypothetical protein